MNIAIDNEFKNLIPPLTPDEYSGLQQSIMQAASPAFKVKCTEPEKPAANRIVERLNDMLRLKQK